MRNFKGESMIRLSALLVWGLVTMTFVSMAGGQTVQATEQRGAEGRIPAAILPSTEPPFEMRVSGDEESFLPHSAWHCADYAINNVQIHIPIDQPDTPAIFFRDAKGTIHMFAMGIFNYAFVGSSVNDLREDCHSVYLSHLDSDPRHFEQYEWIRAAYTLDGTHVYGVVHNENHCTDRFGPDCIYEALTAIHSDDGGYTFRDEPLPQRLIATIPYKDVMEIPRGPGKASGVGDNSDIIRNPNDGYFYMTTADHTASKLCILRSRDLNTWLAWDGTSFSVQMNNLRAYNNPPDVFHCAAGGRASLHYLSQYNLFLGLYRRDGDAFYQVSSDLVHWSAPERVMLPGPIGRRNDGSAALMYPGFFDPKTNSTNFDVINPGDQLYLLVVKDTPPNDGRRPFYGRGRELVRFPLSFTPVDSDKDAVHAAAVTFTPGAGSYDGAKTVALTCKTPFSMIYYTTDGQPPAMDTFFTKQYTGPLEVTQSEKITALCLSTGYRPGQVRAARYTIDGGG
jgi:hypothetical protein